MDWKPEVDTAPLYLQVAQTGPLDFGVELRRDGAQRLAAQLHDARDGCGFPFAGSERLAALAAAFRAANPRASLRQFPDDFALVVLSDRAKHLTDQDTGRVGCVGEFNARASLNHAHPEVAEGRKQRFRNDQVARETVAALDKHKPNAVAGDALDHRGEAFPRVCVGASRASLIAELVNDANARGLRIGRAYFALAREAVAVDLRCTGNAEVGNGLDHAGSMASFGPCVKYSVEYLSGLRVSCCDAWACVVSCLRPPFLGAARNPLALRRGTRHRSGKPRAASLANAPRRG